MVILDLLPSNNCGHQMCFGVERRRLYASEYCSLYETISKLSTKDLLALASMKNVAKREM